MGSGESMRVCLLCRILARKMLILHGGLVDYILFIKADVDIEPNLNEVRDTRYVTADGLKAMFNDPALSFTPWFKLICHTLLFEWWEHLDEGLEKYENEQEIRRML